LKILKDRFLALAKFKNYEQPQVFSFAQKMTRGSKIDAKNLNLGLF
jgi:hypothetical protein